MAGGDGAKPPTASTIRQGCGIDHAKYCPTGAGGTRSDIACLQQHHLDLTISCRNLLRRAKAATPGDNAGGGAQGGAIGGQAPQ